MKKIKAFFVKCKDWCVNAINKVKAFFKRFNLINGWKKGMGAKQPDKVTLHLRVWKITVIDLRIDFNKEFRLILFNLGLHFT